MNTKQDTKQKIKAVIFDMDGLLIDSEPFWQEAEVETFKEVGVPLTYEWTGETMGMRVDEVVEHWYVRYPWNKPPKKEIEARIVERVIALVKEKGEPRRGVAKIVQLFWKAGIPMAIASSSQTEIINAVLEKIHIRDQIRMVHSAEHEPYGKPHPGVYITTTEKLGVRPMDCLAFEDSPNGVLAAKAAKMKCIAVPDQIPREDKRFVIADLIIDSLEDFRLEYLESL